MKEIIVNVDNYNENSIKTIEGDNLSEVYKIYICKNKRRVNLTNKIVIMAYVNDGGIKKSNILALNITNAAEGEIELPITNVISNENGVYACQIAIYGENNSLEQTAPFSLIVENNIFSKTSNTAINSSDFHILSEAIKTTSEYAEKLQKGTENIELQYADKLNLFNSQLSDVVKSVALLDILSMPKAINNIKEGNKIITDGFYKVNDGGGATYIIVKDDNLLVDGMFVFELGEFKLKIVLKDEFDVRQLGFKDSQYNNEIFDNTPLFKKLNNYIENNNINFKIKFPSGWFGFSSGANWNRVNKMGCSITGSTGLGEMFRKGLNNNNSSIGTIFFAIEENQPYIMKFGGDLIPNTYSNLEYVNVNDITFWGGTCSVTNGKFTVDRFGNGCREMLVFDYCSFCKYDNLTFTGGINVINCLRVKGFEHFIGTLIFRDVGKIGVLNSCVRFEAGNKTNYEVTPSGTIINNISMENCSGSILDLYKCVELTIDNISVEVSNLNNIISKVENSKEINDKKNLSLIRFSSTFGAVNINSITCQHISKYVYDGYCYNTLLYNYNDYGYGTGINIDTVNLQDCGYELKVLDYKANNLDSSYGVPFDEPIINFNRILTNSESISYKILAGIQVNKADILQNIYLNNENVNNIICNKLTPLNSRYPSRLGYDNSFKAYYSYPLISNYTNADERVKKKFFNVKQMYYTNTNIHLQTSQLKGYIILSKLGDSQKTCLIKLYYEDGSETKVDVNKSIGNKIECLTFTLPVTPNKRITALSVEQVEDRLYGEYEYLMFYEMMLQI
ncbi:hypothetical protein QTI12_14790 [Clostridium perfringens]|nr:hypothetical protein [Clostridium perfringens]